MNEEDSESSGYALVEGTGQRRQGRGDRVEETALWSIIDDERNVESEVRRLGWMIVVPLFLCASMMSLAAVRPLAIATGEGMRYGSRAWMLRPVGRTPAPSLIRGVRERRGRAV